MIGHIADAQYLFCSAGLGKPNPAPGIEKSKTTKADLVQALKDAFAYSDQAWFTGQVQNEQPKPGD
ncbi:MAG: hypothetical protein EHM23_31235 [Acidobacteria bacterium]|nr:MAG: hypothetical protein EHM23_31235 [Acidobacteriota bacterium]